MLGTVFHYSVMEPVEHSQCYAQRNRVIQMHEGMGYRDGGAYNGHFCIHGEKWVSYLGPNEATGNGWANLNLHAWCYLATVGTPVTPEAAQAAYDFTLVEPTGRDQIYPHSAFFATACCGDPLRDWIAQGALPPSTTPRTLEVPRMYIAIARTVFGVSLGVLMSGARKVREFTGPEGAYGIPQSALDWKGTDGRDAVPFVFVEWADFEVLISPWPVTQVPASGGATGGATKADVAGIVKASETAVVAQVNRARTLS